MTPLNAALVVDLMIGLGVLLHALDGYRRGLVRTLGSAIGLVTGALLGLHYGPGLVEQVSPDLAPVTLTALLVGFVVVAAGVGRALTARLTRAVFRGHAASGVVDAVSGALLTAVVAAGVVWLGAGLVRGVAPGEVVDVIDESRVLTGLDRVSPVSRDDLLDRGTALFAQSDFPRVFDGGSGEALTPVDPADPAVAGDAEVARAAASVVRVDATAPRCGGLQEGSGFVVAPGLVVTNAHVVTGSSRVDIRKDRLREKARVVAFDPNRDLAVLSVDTSTLTPIPLADDDLDRGQESAVAGYPLGGPFQVDAARVRELVTARGRDIYDADAVSRDIYALRAEIHPGNSGGPLLTTDGEVAGVVFARSFDDAATAYALRLSELSPVLESARSREPTPVGLCIEE